MTTTTKPPSTRVPVTAPPCAQPQLSPAEERWLQCWRKMDDRRRAENLKFIELQAGKYPRHVAARLTLIMGVTS